MFVVQLLAPDVRHERNVVLQCVRFIVRSGFFGLAAKTLVRSVCCEPHAEDVSRDGDPQRESAGEHTRVKESVLQQLFAQQLVCDESEETHHWCVTRVRSDEHHTWAGEGPDSSQTHHWCVMRVRSDEHHTWAGEGPDSSQTPLMCDESQIRWTSHLGRWRTRLFSNTPLMLDLMIWGPPVIHSDSIQWNQRQSNLLFFFTFLFLFTIHMFGLSKEKTLVL